MRGEIAIVICEVNRNSSFERHDDAPTYWQQESQLQDEYAGL